MHLAELVTRHAHDHILELQREGAIRQQLPSFRHRLARKSEALVRGLEPGRSPANGAPVGQTAQHRRADTRFRPLRTPAPTPRRALPIKE